MNSATTPKRFPIPLNRDTFQQLNGKRVLTLLDNRKGYYQLLLTAAATVWTTFWTPIGSYMYLRIPFGLISAPAYYNFLIVTLVLAGLIGLICVAYFDDTVVFSDDHEQHLKELRTVFERFAKYHLTLNGPKCAIAKSQVAFWGHLVDGTGYNHLPERQAKALSYPRPNTRKQLERFLGLATYFSAHLEHFALLRRRLAAIASAKSLNWTDDAINAFNELKSGMFNSKKLYFPDYSLEFHQVVDASKSGIGGYLYQLRGTVEEPLVFVSLAFNATQSNWATEEQEAFAIYFCVMYAAWILRGCHFYIHTDHKNLIYIRTHASAKVIRWNLRLQEFDFTILHHAGKFNVTDPL